MIHRFGSFELDTKSLTLSFAGRAVDLPRKAVETLAILVEQRGSVVTKDRLMNALWPDGFVEEGNLKQYVYLLRRAFGERGLNEVIQTHHRRGYCFNLLAAPASKPAKKRATIRAFTVAAALALVVVPAAKPTAPSHGLDGSAMEAYALGEYFWNLRSVPSMQRSISYFRRVIALAPESALGYAALANAYTELADLEQPCSECAKWARDAKSFAAKALAVEPASAQARVAYGMTARVFDGNDRLAAREFRAALATDPNDAVANQWYGNLLIAQGNAREGVRRLQIAAHEQPIGTATFAWLARGYYYERRYADAERYALDALALQPTRLETVVLLGFVDEARGNYRAALGQFAEASRLGISGAETQALRAIVYTAIGRRSTALAYLNALFKRNDLDAYTARDVAIGLILANDRSAAKKVLSRIRYHSVIERQLIDQDVVAASSSS
jgi:DNA-binding winged helix-turn-helix (wHTH) protein/Tfp pilus assembly protein PilF